MRGAQCNSGEKEAGRPGRARLSRSASPVARRRPGRGVKGIRQAGMPYSVVQCGYTVPRVAVRATNYLYGRNLGGQRGRAAWPAISGGSSVTRPRPRRALPYSGSAQSCRPRVARVAGAPEHATYATSSSEHWFSSGRKLESSSLLILYGAFAVISF